MRTYKVYLNENFLMYQLYGTKPTLFDLSLSGSVEASSLEEVFRWGNSDEHPYRRSLSVGDVIADSKNTYIVKNVGFEMITL